MLRGAGMDRSAHDGDTEKPHCDAARFARCRYSVSEVSPVLPSKIAC